MSGITDLTTSTTTQQVHAQLQAGDYRGALATAEQLAACTEGVGDDPPSAEAWAAVCRARREMGRFADAEAAGLRAVTAAAQAVGRENPIYASAVRELARCYEELGRPQQAEGLDRQALAIRRAALGNAHPDAAQSLSDLSMVLEWLGHFAESEACAQEAAAIFARPGNERNPGRPAALTNLAFALLWRGNYKVGVAAAAEAHRLAEAIFPAGHPERASAAGLYGRLLQNEFRYERAEQLITSALADRRAALGEGHPYCGSTLMALAGVRQMQRQTEEAESLAREALRIYDASYSADHSRVADACDRLGNALADNGKNDEAEAAYRRAVELYERALGPDNTFTLDSKLALAGVLANSGRAEEAVSQCRDLLARYNDESPLAHSDARQALARALGAAGCMTEAAQHSAAAVKLLREMPGAAESWLTYALGSLSWYQLAIGEVAEGVAAAREAFDLTAAGAGDGHASTAEAARALSSALQQQGDAREAERVLRRVMAHAPAPTPALDLRPDLAGALAMQDKRDEAERLYLQVVADRRRIGPEAPALADALLGLGWFYEQGGNLGAAEPRYREALEIRRAAEGPDGVGVAHVLHTLAGLRYRAGLYPAALQQYREALDVYRRSAGEESPEYACCQHALADFHLETGNLPEAENEIRAAIGKLARLGERNAEHLGARQTLAAILAAGGKYAEARETLLSVHVATCASLGAAHASSVAVQSELASMYLSEGDLLAAEPLLREVAARHREQFPDHASLMIDESRLAQLYTRFGEYEPARRHADACLALARRHGGTQAPGYASGLLLLADVHLLREDYGAALAVVEEALAIQRRAFGNAHPYVAGTQQRLAGMKHDLGRLREARADAAEATAVIHRAFGPNHPEYAVALRNEASLTALADPAAAGELLRRAVELERRCYGDNGAPRVPGLVEWADWHFARKQYAAAEEALREAAGIVSLTGMEENIIHAGIASRLATVLVRTSRAAEAGRYVRQAFDIATRLFGPEHPDTAAAARRLATWHVSQGARPEATATIEGVIAGEDSWGEIAGDGAFAFDRYRSAADAILTDRLRAALLTHSPGAEVRPVYARLVRDRAREAALVAGPPLARVGTGDAEALNRLRRLRAQVVDATLAGPVFVKPEVHFERLGRWREEECRLSAQFPSAPASTPEELSAALPPGGTLVEFVRVFDEVEQDDRSRYAAFVLSAGDASRLRLIDLGSAAQIDREVAEWVPALVTSSQREQKLGQSVAEKLLAPLLPHLGEGEDLFVVADTALRTLPFAALPILNGRRLVDRFGVARLTASAALLNRPEPATEGRPLVLRDRETGGPVAWLRWMVTGRREEAAVLAERLGVTPREAVGIWPWDVAGPVVFLTMPGALDAEPPFVAGKPATRFIEPPTRYGARWKSLRLTVAEVRELRLTRGAVVVMPATAPAAEAGGPEALTWMSRALRAGGAGATVFGLWPTAGWSDHWAAFHKALRAGDSPAAALRKAQLRAKKEDASPRHWAGPICFAG